MTVRTDTVIIGGGAAGMMCAVTSARLGKQIMIAEKNPVLGKKLLITGKGRCNVTNACDAETFFENVVTNPRFLRSAYAGFTTEDTMTFFEQLGVKLKVERGNRVFPVSDKASDIVQAFIKELQRLEVPVVWGRASEICVDGHRVCGVRFFDGREIFCENVVIATGGASYSRTGSTGDGYTLARQCGHTITPLRPGLVPIELQQLDLCRQLQGLSLRNVAVTVVRGEKSVYKDFGEMLFTHYGISGPIVLSASAFVQVGDQIVFDLKPALDEPTLDKRVCRDFEQNNNRDFCNALGGLLPTKLIPVIVSVSGIPAHKKVHSVTRAERVRLIQLLKAFSFQVAGLRPIEEAIITSGGVDVREVDPKSMQSKKISGLYFAGEALDVDAYTGGFNLQIAFCTGHRAGECIK